VHTHTAPANLIGRAARPLAWAPVLVTTAHNLVEGGKGRELAYRLSDGLSNFMTNVSKAAVERYIREGVTPAHRIEYIPNGIDVTRYAPRPEVGRAKRAELGIDDDTFLWLAVGRLTVQKDYPNLIDAFARVADAHPKARVEVVSDGELRDEIAAMIRDRGLEDRMRLLGFRRDVGDLMNAADGFVMSSAWEGLPIVLLESAATGLPMVVTDVGGNHEIVLEGHTGYLAPAHDGAALARQMDKAMSLPRDQWRAMGAAARDHVGATFGMTAIADRWDRIYRGLLVEQGIEFDARFS
jgi:glycosyltransferase involved in cell wall biosynthesis